MAAPPPITLSTASRSTPPPLRTPARAPSRRRLQLPRALRITILLAPAGLVVGVFLVGGVGQALAQSFGYQPFLSDWSWSADAYRALWHDPAVRASIWLTLRVAVLSTALSATFGTMAALAIHRVGRGRRIVTGLFQGNLAVPHLVGALCMSLLLAQSGLLSRLSTAIGLTASPAAFPQLTQDGFGWGIVAEYVWKETPFIGVVALAALSRGVDELDTAARMLGARPWQRARYVLVPLVTPVVAAASALVLAFAVGSYEIPSLLGRPYPATLPVVALQYYRDTDLTLRPQAMAVAVLVAAFSTVLLATYFALTSRLARRPV
ncbi:MAG: ABC transporter permease subunit [Jatrophihabitans sp.]